MGAVVSVPQRIVWHGAVPVPLSTAAVAERRQVAVVVLRRSGKRLSPVRVLKRLASIADYALQSCLRIWQWRRSNRPAALQDFAKYVFRADPDVIAEELINQLLASGAVAWKDDLLVAGTPHNQPANTWIEQFLPRAETLTTI